MLHLVLVIVIKHGATRLMLVPTCHVFKLNTPQAPSSIILVNVLMGSLGTHSEENV
jgi:hypothetical protein